jgi:AAA+ superfamily predicted ATPase
MNSVERIDPELLDQYSEQPPKALESVGVYDQLKRIDEDPHFPSAEEATIADSLKDGLSAYMAIVDEFTSSDVLNSYDIDADAGERQDFIVSYAMYAACKKALNNLGQPTEQGSLDTGVPSVLDPDAYSRDSDEDPAPKPKRVFTAFSQEFASYLRKVDSQDELMSLTADYLGSVAAACHEQMEQHPAYMDVVGDINLEINGYTLSGLNGQGVASGDTVKDIAWEDIVGNEDMKTRTESLVKVLMDYDPETGENEMAEIAPLPNFIVFYGEPGTGKSMGLAAAANQAQDLAEDIGKEVHIKHLDSDIRSKYHGESSERLQNWFDELTDDSRIGIGLADDMESLIQSRDELEGEPEDKDLFRKFITNIQGADSKEDQNNYIVIGTTNFPELFDDALDDRAVSIEVPGPETADEYRDILSLQLDDIHDDLLEIDDIDALGEHAYDADLSGRALENIVETLSTQDELAFSDDFYHLSREEKHQRALEQMDTITDDDIYEAIDDYVENKEQQEERAREREAERKAKKQAMDDVLEEDGLVEEKKDRIRDELSGILGDDSGA